MTSEADPHGMRPHDTQLERIIDETPFMKTHCSRDVRYRFVRHADADMAGRCPADIEGQSIAECIGDEAFVVKTPPEFGGPPCSSCPLTAYARSDDRVKALHAAVHIHVGKPIGPAELFTTVAPLPNRFGQKTDDTSGSESATRSSRYAVCASPRFSDVGSAPGAPVTRQRRQSRDVLFKSQHRRVILGGRRQE